jgi:2-aminobenzoate-CoA ligase
MGKIPENMLPPKDLWPEYLVPEEFADTPDELNLTDFLLDRHVREGKGDNAAIKFMDQTVSYAQLQKMVNKFGNSLKDADVEPQDRVGIRKSARFLFQRRPCGPVKKSHLWPTMLK